MSWAPAGRTAAAGVTLGPQQQHTPRHRQRHQQHQQREILERQQHVQPPQLTTPLHRQLRTQRPHVDNVYRVPVQIHEAAGQKHRRQPKASNRNLKNGSGGEDISSAHASLPRRSCTYGNTLAGEAAGKRGTQPGSAIVASQMFKTKLCIDHQTRGCTRGDSCPYAHSVEEMRNLPDLRKTKMCSLVLAGKGCKNRACKFAHSEEELRYTCTFSEFKTRICRFAQERGGRGCLYGVRCPYAHSPSELRPPENSAFLPTNHDHPKEKRNEGDDDNDEALFVGQQPSGNDPSPSDQHDIKGKHGFWRQEGELQLDHSRGLRQQENVLQQEKERLKQQPQGQIWQKSQKPSPQVLGEQISYMHQRQQPGSHQHRKQSRMQLQTHYRQQHLRNVQSTTARPTRNSDGQSHPPDEADMKEGRVRKGVEEVPMRGVSSSSRSPPPSDASPFVQDEGSFSLLEPNETRQETGGSALAKLPRSLHRGTRALSTMANTGDAGGGLKSLSEGRPQHKINLNSAEDRRQDPDAHQREQRQARPEEPEIPQYQGTGSQSQESASMRHVQQPSWGVEVCKEEAGTTSTPELVQGGRTWLPVGETSPHYVSVNRSAGVDTPQRVMTSVTVAAKVRSTVENTYDLGGAYGDTSSDAINDAQRECLRCFSAISEADQLEIDTDTPISERDQGWSYPSMSSTGYNGAAPVLPPPGFEHVRVKPLSEFAYARMAPWVHSSATTKSSNREECLLFHLHRQLLLHCQRQSDAHVLPRTNTRPQPPSTADEPAAANLRSEISYLGGSANKVWEDAFLTATRSPNL